MRVLVAIVVSLAAHAALIFAVAAYLDRAPLPDVAASLDLSSVELSFAEKSEEAPPAAAQTAAAVREKTAPARETAEVGRLHEMLEKPAPAPRVGPTSSVPPPEPSTEIAAAEPESALERPAELPEARPRSAAPTVPVPTASAAPRQARVDAPPRPQRSIRPDYPRGARRRGEQGDVVLEISVSASGAVDAVRVVGSSGFTELDAEAVRAAEAARFAPAMSGNEPVASKARLTLTFKLK